MLLESAWDLNLNGLCFEMIMLHTARNDWDVCTLNLNILQAMAATLLLVSVHMALKSVAINGINLCIQALINQNIVDYDLYVDQW